MQGWFRDFRHDMNGAINTGNHNRFMDESAVGGHVKGIVFDRVHPQGVQEDADGQWAIASVQSAGEIEEHTSELQSRFDLVCRLLLEKKNDKEHRTRMTGTH